jgi:hypothetical protein
LVVFFNKNTLGIVCLSEIPTNNMCIKLKIYLSKYRATISTFFEAKEVSTHCLAEAR